MTDITAAFNECLTARSARPVTSIHYTIDKLDAFVKEAYNINTAISELSSSLRAARPAYLSTSSTHRRTVPTSKSARTKTSAQQQAFTDTERIALDAHAKLVLRQLLASTEQLSDAETLRHEAATQVSLAKRAKGGLGAVARWAGGGAITARSLEEEGVDGREDAVAKHRAGVIGYLRLRLGVVGAYQLGMMEIRLKREEERTKSVLAKSPVVHVNAPWTGEETRGVQEEQEKKQGGYQLSEEQMQLFAQENQDLLRHFEDQRDQLRATQKSIEEVAELQSALVANLDTQAESIEQLVQDSFNTTDNIGRGNKELKRATERVSTARLCFHGTVAFCAFLVVWDLAF